MYFDTKSTLKSYRNLIPKQTLIFLTGTNGKKLATKLYID